MTTIQFENDSHWLSNAFSAIRSPIAIERKPSELRRLYQQSQLARTVVDTVPAYTLHEQSIDDDVAQLFLDFTREARIVGRAFLLKESSSSKEIYLVRACDCTYNCDDETVTYKTRVYYNNNFLMLEGSALQASVQAIEEYLQNIASMNVQIRESSLFVLKTKGLVDMSIDNQAKANYARRVENLVKSKESSNGVAIDMEYEELDFVERSLADLDALINVSVTNLVAHSGLPKSFLFGFSESTAMSSSGNADWQQLDSIIQQYRRFVLKPFMNFVVSRRFEPNYDSIIPNDPKKDAEVFTLKSNSAIALYNAGLISQSTAQSMLNVPLEAIEAPIAASNSQTPIGNTFSSDLTGKQK